MFKIYKIIIITFSLIFFSFSSNAHVQHYDKLNRIEFDIYRNNNHIGKHVFSFNRSDDKLAVESEINFQIKKLGVVLYKYYVKGTEIYENGKLKEILKEADMYVPGSIKTTHKMSVPSIGYSTPEAKKFIQDDIKTMGKLFNKASQQAIKIMIDGVKGERYDAMDIIQSIKSGPAGDTSMGIRDMLIVLWSKIDKRFRSYLRGKKRR